MTAVPRKNAYKKRMKLQVITPLFHSAPILVARSFFRFTTLFLYMSFQSKSSSPFLIASITLAGGRWLSSSFFI